MDITYKREMKHNYLIVKGEGDQSGYAEKMLAGNHIEGLLKFRVKLADNEKLYYYEITSRQPLKRLLNSRNIKSSEISRLILGISQVLEKIDAFLLSEEQILMDPEYIYTDPETGEFGLCLVPGYHGDFPAALTKLLQYLLGKVDHQDKESVVLAYSLFQESQKENYGMKDLLKLLYPANGGCETEEEHEADFSERSSPESEDGENIKEEPLVITKKQRQKPWYQLLFLPAGMAGLYGWGGRDAFYNGWKWIAGVEFALIIITILIWNKRSEPELEKEQAAGKSSEFNTWHMEFEDKSQEEADESLMPKPDIVHSYREENTVLLAETEKRKEFHKLVSLQPERQDILLEYYPFIIGKQEGIADYVLAKDTVSRLHVRLDEQDGRYLLTDLNSTNGTVVNGSLLDNNACVELSPGDEVYIADAAYRFL